MELRPEIQLKGAIKALTDVVIPAVDPDNKLAQEQVRLVLGTLQIVANRMHLLYRYDRHEIERLTVLARELGRFGETGDGNGEATRAAADRLSRAGHQGGDVLDRARAEPSELETTIRSLREAISGFIRAVHADGRAHVPEVRRAVLVAAKEQLDRERAWVLAHGFESDPDSVAGLETLIDPLSFHVLPG